MLRVCRWQEATRSTFSSTHILPQWISEDTTLALRGMRNAEYDAFFHMYLFVNGSSEDKAGISA